VSRPSAGGRSPRPAGARASAREAGGADAARAAGPARGTRRGAGHEAPAYDPATAAFLEEVYGACAAGPRLRRDPLALVVPFDDPRDREVAGLFASTLAFGSVDLILRAVRTALEPLGERPASALAAMGESGLREAWGGFQYRYCFPKDMIALARGARRALMEAGSLEDFFLRGDPGGGDVAAAAGSFAARLKDLSAPGGGAGRAGAGGALAGGAAAGAREGAGEGIRGNLLPEPAGGSACKRLFLFLRWMARRDAVDPGGWDRVDPARLIVPMDTHMARVCSDRLGFLPRPAADLKAALRVTEAFRLYAPEDPVRYDFALTRPGIDPEPGDERFGCS